MDIGTRMKSYESDERLPKGTVIIRVDGKAFHTWTRKVHAIKPFDHVIHQCMSQATKKVAEEMQGFKLAYTQSDESSFLIANLGENEGAWFDYKPQKLASITASMFTQAFNDSYEYHSYVSGYPRVTAVFDARAYSVPVNDAANVFVWRQQDWKRNSVQMLGHHHLGHKAMQGLSSIKVQSALGERGINWGDLDPWKKYGTFVVPETLLTTHEYMHYDEINRVTGLDQHLEI